MDSLPTKIGKVSICFDGSINDGYLRFQLDHHPDSLPDFNISIKDGKAVKFIETHLGSSYRAIEELINHKFDGIPRELVDFIHINKPDSKVEKSMCFDLNITRRGGQEAVFPSTSSALSSTNKIEVLDYLPCIEKGYLLVSHNGNFPEFEDPITATACTVVLLKSTSKIALIHLTIADEPNTVLPQLKTALDSESFEIFIVGGSEFGQTGRKSQYLVAKCNRWATNERKILKHDCLGEYNSRRVKVNPKGDILIKRSRFGQDINTATYLKV